uniref:Uncharacterized protein n=1 Tax=viral metagenome TaxID=1070528 RepID=A0A6C0JU53_9ZZZZ
MLFVPEIDVDYKAKYNKGEFKFTVLDTMVPTRINITNQVFGTFTDFRKAFIDAKGDLFQVTETTFVSMDNKTTDTVYTLGEKITSLNSIELVYNPKAGQVWYIGNESKNTDMGEKQVHILIVDDSKWPLKCVYFDYENIKAKNYVYLGRNMRLFDSNNKFISLEYASKPHATASRTNTIYFPNDEKKCLDSFCPEGKSYWNDFVGEVEFYPTSSPRFPMEMDTCNNKVWVDPIGNTWFDKECSQFAFHCSQKFTSGPKPVNEMFSDPKILGKYEIAWGDSTTHIVVLTDKNTFVYYKDCGSLEKGLTRTFKPDGTVFALDGCQCCGKITSSKFLGWCDDLISNQQIHGLYTCVIDESGSPISNIVVIAKDTIVYLDEDHLEGQQRTLKGHDLYNHGYKSRVYKASFFTGFKNDVVNSPIVRGIYEVMYEKDTGTCQMILTATNAFRYPNHQEYTYYIKNGITYCNENLTDQLAIIKSSRFLKMADNTSSVAISPTVTTTVSHTPFEVMLQGKLKEQKDHNKKISDLVAKRNDAFDAHNKYMNTLDEEIDVCKKAIKALWNCDETCKIYKKLTSVLSPEKHLWEKEDYIKKQTIPTDVKKYVLSLLEKQLECALSEEQEKAIQENIDVLNKVKDTQ